MTYKVPLEVIVMPKSKDDDWSTWSEERIDAYIRKRYNERANWKTITAELKQHGVLSRRTQKPLTLNSVRFRFHGRKTPRTSQEAARISSRPEKLAATSVLSDLIPLPGTSGSAERENALVRAALQMQSDDKSILNLIRQILNS
jgi:hypothetical protein